MNYFFRKRKRPEEEDNETEDPLVKRLRQDPDTVWDSIEEDQDDTNMSTFKHIETKIEDLNDLLRKMIKEFYEEMYGGTGGFNWTSNINDDNKKTRLYHKLRHLFIAYIHKLRKWLKNKFVLNSVLTYYQKIQLYYAIISDNFFVTSSIIFVECLAQHYNTHNDNNDIITLLDDYFEMFRYEITSTLNFTLTGQKLVDDIFDSNDDSDLIV